MTADEYLQLIDGWTDPNPEPVIEEHDGITVVRDDLLGAGSKMRSVDYLIGHDSRYSNISEWVFGSCPATGYAQISLPAVCKRYGKQAVLFMAKRSESNMHEYQLRGRAEGAKYYWVPNGMLTVTQRRAKDYAGEMPTRRCVLPLGLEHPTVIASIVKIARSLDVSPRVVWSVGSSGTLNRGLQLAWPDAEVHVVQVGHSMNAREIGRAVHHKCSQPFHVEVKSEDAPPFPSAATYDAKAWRFILDHHQERRDGVLFWNVGA